jgi:hypothetical protein
MEVSAQLLEQQIQKILFLGSGRTCLITASSLLSVQDR